MSHISSSSSAIIIYREEPITSSCALPCIGAVEENASHIINMVRLCNVQKILLVAYGWDEKHGGLANDIS
jgi:hypothetical protein